jgi:hypothetical protein
VALDPALPTIAAAWSTTSSLGTPIVMIACSASCPRVISTTASCACAAEAKACVAPNSRALARLNSTGSTTITFALWPATNPARRINELPAAAGVGYGLRVGMFMVMVRRVRRGTSATLGTLVTSATDVGMAPAR